MKLRELTEKLRTLVNGGWGDYEVYAVSNAGSKLNEPVVDVSVVNPPVPKPAPFVCILVDD